jgi:hypothetical protein
MGCLQPQARDLMSVTLADFLIFAVRLAGARHGPYDGTDVAKRTVHLIAQQLELGVEGAAESELPALAPQASASAVTNATRRSKDVRIISIARRFMSKSSRGILTAASDTRTSDLLLGADGRDHGQGPGTQLLRLASIIRPRLCAQKHSSP